MVRGVPDMTVGIANELIKNSCAETGTTVDHVIKDIDASWRLVVVLIASSLIMSYALIIMLRFVVSIFVWLTIGLFLCVIIAFGIYLLAISSHYQNKEDKTDTERTYAKVGCVCTVATTLELKSY